MDTPDFNKIKPLPKATARDWLACFLGGYRRWRVEGRSMLPVLEPNDIIFSKALPKQLTVGDIVVAQHPYKAIILIKRLYHIEENGDLFLLSDNLAEGSDSRRLGSFSPSSLKGIAVSYSRL